MGKVKAKRKHISEPRQPNPGPKKSKKKSSHGGAAVQPRELNDESTFGSMVKQAGFVLIDGNFPNELSVDQAIFQSKLKTALKRCLDVKQVVEEFTTGIQNHIEDPVRFKYSLLPTTTTTDCQSARSGSQESMVKLLLGIDDLQPSLINVLLEKLPEFMDDQDSMFDYSGAVNLPRLILNQFRWLDRILNSQEMTNKMLEMVDVSSLLVQQEIISCIPEVVSDSEHNTVAAKLQEVLIGNSALIVPVLDALSNLNLTPDLMTEVRTTALQTLLSAELADLPVIINFILQSVNSGDALEVVGQLRANLELPASLPPVTTVSTAYPGSQRNGTSDSTVLIFDAIKSNMRFQKLVADSWIKTIKDVDTAAKHKVVDIFILLIIHNVAPARKKALESLFRSKVLSGLFKEQLLVATFSSHSQVLREYFPSVLSLADVLLRSFEPIVSLFACSVYKQAFLTFDMYCKQEVIGSLVAHIGSGLEAEIEAGLNILISLVDNHATKVAPFAIFIKGILDYIGNLSLPQIRKLFSILSRLAFGNSRDCSAIQDELHIVIRKQLSSNNPKYKRIGVIGALMVMSNLARSDRSGQERELSTDVYEKTVSLLELARSSSNSMPEAAALFFDELATIVGQRQLHHTVEAWIGESIMNDFQDDFVVDIDADRVSGNYCLPMKEVFGLEAEDSEGAVAINLLPLVSNAERAHLNLSLGSISNVSATSQRAVSPLCMASHFRLMRVCEQVQHGGDLDGIDALLGCPLYSVDDEVVSKVTSLSPRKRERLCTCLFLSVNWFREVVNAFAASTDPEMRGKVLHRLQDITTVQKHLQMCLTDFTGYTPPAANFDGDSSVLNTSVSSTSATKRPRKPKEKKTTGANQSILDYCISQSNSQNTSQNVSQRASQLETQASSSKEPSKQGGGMVDMQNCRTFFRELEIDVFNILSCRLVSRTVLDSDMNTQEVQELRLHPPELCFLLEDLHLKLEHSLIASASKRISFLKPKTDKNIGFSRLNVLTPQEVARKAVNLLQYICDHLEANSTFFQTFTEENDGVRDGPGSDTPEYNQRVACLHLLLKCLLCLFSWNEFATSDNEQLLKEALTVLATRTGRRRRSQAAAAQLHKEAFKYVNNFADTLPDLPTSCCLLRLLEALGRRSVTKDLDKNIADMAESLLKREWLDRDGSHLKGATHNGLLQTLLTVYLCHTPDGLQSVKNICSIGLLELVDSDTHSTTYPTLNRSSFSTYYRIIFDHLVTCVRGLCSDKAAVGDPRSLHDEELLKKWHLTVNVFHILLNLLKTFGARNNISSALKDARVIVELFLRHGMPLLDRLFPHKREDIMKLLKNLQQCTRPLNNLCSHSKAAKDVSLTSRVPAMKRCLEQFLYRVKAMLTLHNCQDAFWLGNLKNKDLHGVEILSQASSANASEQGDDDADLVPDSEEDSNDESTTTMGQDGNSNSDEGSYSESF